jgi:hypothetical protein
MVAVKGEWLELVFIHSATTEQVGIEVMHVIFARCLFKILFQHQLP